MFFLGVVSGQSGAFNNYTGGSGTAGFVIPVGTRSLFLAPSQSGLSFECFGYGIPSGLAATSCTGAAFNTTAVRAAPLAAAGGGAFPFLFGPFRLIPQVQHLVSIYFAGGAWSCKVYSEPTI